MRFSMVRFSGWAALSLLFAPGVTAQECTTADFSGRYAMTAEITNPSAGLTVAITGDGPGRRPWGHKRVDPDQRRREFSEPGAYRSYT